MKAYKKIYIEFFGYFVGEWIPSEMSGSESVDIHHLTSKKMGGSKLLDYPENLVALTREEHTKCHADKHYNYQVQIKHLETIRAKKPNYQMRPEYNELLKLHYLTE
jgi:hypothetical protein